MIPFAVKFSKYLRTNGEPNMRLLHYTLNGAFYRINYSVKIVSRSKITKFSKEKKENIKPGINSHVITNRCTIHITWKQNNMSDVAAKWIAFMINNSTRLDPHLWGEFDDNITEVHYEYSASRS